MVISDMTVQDCVLHEFVSKGILVLYGEEVNNRLRDQCLCLRLSQRQLDLEETCFGMIDSRSNCYLRMSLDIQ